MGETRVCTLKDGRRYVVQQLELRSDDPSENFVHTWGELVSYRGLRAKYEGSKKFRMDKVVIETVPRTEALLDTLLRQHVAARRAKGDVVTRTRGGNYQSHGTPLDRARAVRLRDRGAEAQLWRLATEAESRGLETQVEGILELIERTA